MRKRLLSILLVLSMLTSMIPLGALTSTAEGTELSMDIYGTGLENWGGNTQLLLTLGGGDGIVNALWNNKTQYEWVVTIDGVPYSWVPDSNYDFGNGTMILRFTSCINNPKFVPVKGQEYAVSKIEIVKGGEVQYYATSSKKWVLNVEPIAQVPGSGRIQEGLYWAFDGDQTLTIYGKEMPDELPFDNNAGEPWNRFEPFIKTVKFEGFMTQISGSALAHLDKLETVYVPEGVTTIRGDAFAYNSALKTLYLPSTLTSIKQGTTWGSGNIQNVYYTGTEADWTAKVKTIDAYNSDTTNHLNYCTVAASGTGEGYTWTSYSNGTTIFNGEGETVMATATAGEQPWKDATTSAYFFGFKEIGSNALARTSVVKVWVAQGTTKINGDAFAYVSSLKEVTLPNGIEVNGGAFFESKNLSTVYSGPREKVLNASVSTVYNDPFFAANKFCMEEDPIVLTMGKYGDGIENSASKTQLLITLKNADVDIEALNTNKANYTWKLTIDGKTYIWQPDSFYGSGLNIFRFTPMLYENYMFIDVDGEYKVEKLEINAEDGRTVYEATSTETWKANEGLKQAGPIYPEGGLKLNLSVYGSGMENWSNETQILATVKSDSVNITNLFNNRGNYVWELTVNGTPYNVAPSTNYPFSTSDNIYRFEPCKSLYSDFVPVKDQEYPVSLKIYDSTGTNVLFYTDTVGGFKITVDPIPHHSATGVSAEAPTCVADGTVAYYYCTYCETEGIHYGKYYEDEAMTTVIDDITDPAIEHSYTGEYRDNGNGTHSRKCVNGCGEFGEPENHNFNEDGVCVCGLKQIAVPTAVTGLTYNGNVQTGVKAGEGYTLEGNVEKDAGTYTAIATLANGYVWADDSFDGKIEWTIAKATVAVPTAETTQFLYTGETITVLEDNEYYTVTDGSATEIGKYTAVVTLSDSDNYVWATDFDGEIEWEIISREEYNLINEICEKNGLMGRQGLIKDGVVSDTIGRTIIPITQEQLDSIVEYAWVVGFDGYKNVKVKVDCAYTWFYDGDEKIEAEGMTNAAGEAIVAFIIIDNDGAQNTITGFGYYRVYCDEIVDDSTHFLFDARYAAPNAK